MLVTFSVTCVGFIATKLRQVEERVENYLRQSASPNVVQLKRRLVFGAVPPNQIDNEGNPKRIVVRENAYVIVERFDSPIDWAVVTPVARMSDWRNLDRCVPVFDNDTLKLDIAFEPSASGLVDVLIVVGLKPKPY